MISSDAIVAKGLNIAGISLICHFVYLAAGHRYRGGDLWRGKCVASLWGTHPRAGSCETKAVSEPIVSVTVVSTSSFRALGIRAVTMALSLLPIPAELASLTSVDDIRQWTGVQASVWQHLSVAFGTVPSVRGFEPFRCDSGCFPLRADHTGGREQSENRRS